jgi:DNA-binding PadR family transcriptional regulator
LDFLVGKGYISCSEIKHPVHRGKKEKMYKITPAGVEIIEGIKEDESIFLEADHQEGAQL